ncbi:MAG: TrbI/VirB10 family protein [Elusimicrobiota bacterium]|nr:MAG: TrbI/VirB10 family protein [Elusimicrobiota bacterium]
MTCFPKLLAAALFAAAPVSAQETVVSRAFRDKKENAGPPAKFMGVTQKTPTKTNYFLPTGFTFPVRLENAVYSYNAETPAIGIVERDVVYLRRVTISAGTRVIGTVAVIKSHDRVLVNFHTLVFETGDEVKFTGMALSLDGAAGLKGKVETHKDAAVANTVLRSFVNGTQAALDMSGVSPVASSATQGITQEAVKELDVQRQEVTQSITIEAETGLRVYIPQRFEF